MKYQSHPNNASESFHFRYSAKEQKEIQTIRDKYVKKEKPAENPIERLRRLDRQVTQKAEVVSLVAGILGALIFGTGLTLVLLNQGFLFLLGILIGAVGLCGIAAAYPLYITNLKKGRERIAPEILRLSDEILQD